MYRNKKGVSELISFALITSLIILASISAFFVAKNVIDQRVGDIDRENVYSDFLKMSYHFSQIQNFNNATFSVFLNFKNGYIDIDGNQIYYQTLKPYASEDEYCFSNVCHVSFGGYERIYYNLSGGYLFDSNLRITGGTYIVSFKNNRASNEIEVRIN